MMMSSCSNHHGVVAELGSDSSAAPVGGSKAVETIGAIRSHRGVVAMLGAAHARSGSRRRWALRGTRRAGLEAAQRLLECRRLHGEGEHLEGADTRLARCDGAR